MNSEGIFLNAFNLASNSQTRWQKIFDYFGSFKNAWESKTSEFLKIGLDQNWIDQFTAKKISINPEKEWEKLDKENIKVILQDNAQYPSLLKEIHQPPFFLYAKGQLIKEDDNAIAVVGARQITQYGQQATYDLVLPLSQNGITIVSGLARGVDTLAHKSALDANGRTIAVLGSGIDRQSIYPSENRYLADKIIEQGAILSEYPIGTLALPYHFPARNRIISGISKGVLVIESKEKSGTLLTAKHALEQNRDIFAIPGSIYSQYSKGTNALIKLGAKLVTCSGDILDELNIASVQSLPLKNTDETIFDPKEKIIFKSLSKEPTHIDKIIELTKLDTPDALSILALMEIKGLVRNLGGMNYINTK